MVIFLQISDDKLEGMLQQRVLRQVDCEMMDNLPLTANETASEMVLLENAHVDCALYICNPNTPSPLFDATETRLGASGETASVQQQDGTKPFLLLYACCCGFDYRNGNKRDRFAHGGAENPKKPTFLVSAPPPRRVKKNNLNKHIIT